PAEDLRLHRLVLRDLEPFHDPLDAVACEEADEIILAREVEARLAGIALTPGSAAQLVVDPAGLVPLGAEHVEPAELAHAVAELDVDAAARHVGGDRHRAGLAGIIDGLRFARVLLRVEDVPTSTGWPFTICSLMSRMTAANLPSFDLKTRSCLSIRATDTFVGISTTLRS